LGQELDVRVDEIDDKGKVSLSPAGDGPEPSEQSSAAVADDASPDVVRVSFEDAFDAELAGELGDLGPATAPTGSGPGASEGRRDDGRGRDRGGDRGRRRHR
jgi:polyribonucleotide nucleotidyltransferase